MLAVEQCQRHATGRGQASRARRVGAWHRAAAAAPTRGPPRRPADDGAAAGGLCRRAAQGCPGVGIGLVVVCGSHVGVVSGVAAAMQNLLLVKLWVSSIGHVRHAPSVAMNPMDAAISLVFDMSAVLAAA